MSPSGSTRAPSTIAAWACGASAGSETESPLPSTSTIVLLTTITKIRAPTPKEAATIPRHSHLWRGFSAFSGCVGTEPT